VSTYTYYGAGQRVKKVSGGVTTVYVYDAFGNLAAEYFSQTPTSPCGTATCYLVTDHLGSTRMLTDIGGSGGTASNTVHRYDFLPFGGELLANVNGRSTGMGYFSTLDGMNPRFTSKERDAETGLDFFGARYMSSAQGRFASPDPLPGWAKDPQSWNLYAYGRNNPLKYVDPDGETHRVCDADGKNCSDQSDAQFESERRADSRNGEQFNNGSLYHNDSNGNRINVGTYRQTDVDIDPSVASALRSAGMTSSAHLNAFKRNAAITAAGGLAFPGATAAGHGAGPGSRGITSTSASLTSP